MGLLGFLGFGDKAAPTAPVKTPGGTVGAPTVPAGSVRLAQPAAVKPIPMGARTSPLGNRKIANSAALMSEIGATSTAPAAKASLALSGGFRRKNRNSKYKMPGRRQTRRANRKTSRKASRKASRKNRRTNRK